MISNRHGTPKITLAEITTTNWNTIISSNFWKKFQKTRLRISVVLHVIGSLNTPAYLTTWRASLVNICFSYSVEILAIKTGRRVDSKCLQCPAPTLGWTGGERWFSVPILSWSKVGLAVTANKVNKVNKQQETCTYSQIWIGAQLAATEHIPQCYTLCAIPLNHSGKDSFFKDNLFFKIFLKIEVKIKFFET